MGAHARSSLDKQWWYINVRRLLLFVDKSIEEGMQWVVSGPNDEPLARFVNDREFSTG